MKEFAISLVTESHSRIEAALAAVRGEPGNPSLLPELFECLALAIPDSHLSDRYSAPIISAINSICRNCSEERKSSAGALMGLERASKSGDANIRAYAVGAASLLCTPDALRLMLRLLEDKGTCGRCIDLEEHISGVVGLIFSVSPGDALQELGKMLSHPSGEVRIYAAGSLLMFGRPGSPPRLAAAAHLILRDAMVSGSEEARGFFAQGRESGIHPERLPKTPRARKIAEATRALYGRFPELHRRDSEGTDKSTGRGKCALHLAGQAKIPRISR